MLINLETIHRPETLAEAASRLNAPDIYPLYGGGASLIRLDKPEIQAAVDLSKVVGSQCSLADKLCYIEGCATLETIASSDAQLATVINADMPGTLRNAFSLGDVFMECKANSLFLAMLLGLEAQVMCYGKEPFGLDQWFDLTPDQRQQHIIQNVTFPYYAPAPVRVTVEKISRTPTDTPIVAAIGLASGGYRFSTRVTFFCVLVGVADRPVIYLPGNLPKLQSQVSDYRGSAEYRTAVGKIAGQRAVLAAVKRASEGHF